MKRIKFVGLDVHAETIAVAVAEPEGEIRSLGMIPNREESVRKLVKKLGPVEQLRFCYEAGPTGYVLYWQLTKMGAACTVVAPTLLPVKAGDRVKADRWDALKLARNYRAGELMAVWVPDAEHASAFSKGGSAMWGGLNSTHDKNLSWKTHPTICGILTKRFERLALHFIHLIV